MPPPGDNVIDTLRVLGATAERAVVLTDSTRIFPSGGCQAITKLFVLNSNSRGGWSIVGEMDGPEHGSYPPDAPALPRFHTTPCGSVFDLQSGLEWLVGRDTRVNERELEEYQAGEPSCCGSPRQDNAWHWRLPTEDEWRSVRAEYGANPVLDAVVRSGFWLGANDGPRLVRDAGGRLERSRDRFGGLLLVRWRLPDE